MNSSAANGSIQGCLSGSDGNYTVTDSASGKTYNLSGSNDELKAHVGQTVAIQGSPSAASSMGGSSASPSSSASTSGSTSSANSQAGAGSASQQTIAVTSVQKISDSCSAK
jgi:hypothetical protein